MVDSPAAVMYTVAEIHVMMFLANGGDVCCVLFSIANSFCWVSFCL